MTTDRLAVRIDSVQRRKLKEMAERHHVSISEVVRRLIDEAYDDDQLAWRIQLAEEIGQMCVEEVPDPDELSRQLNAKYDFNPD
jgi:hypothetical protein